jgi:hypothetical protein
VKNVGRGNGVEVYHPEPMIPLYIRKANIHNEAGILTWLKDRREARHKYQVLHTQLTFKHRTVD